MARVDRIAILVAAEYGNYPRVRWLKTSIGQEKVYDTGGAAKHHTRFDLATDWTNGMGAKWLPHGPKKSLEQH